MCAYFQTVKGKPTGITKRGKGTMGWFYGCKLHLLINHIGEVISLKITPGNTNDRTPIPEL
jgi:hypothetical protein